VHISSSGMRVARSVILSFSSPTECRKKYPATCPRYTRLVRVTQADFPVFPTERW